MILPASRAQEIDRWVAEGVALTDAQLARFLRANGYAEIADRLDGDGKRTLA